MSDRDTKDFGEDEGYEPETLPEIKEEDEADREDEVINEEIISPEDESEEIIGGPKKITIDRHPKKEKDEEAIIRTELKGTAITSDLSKIKRKIDDFGKEKCGTFDLILDEIFSQVPHAADTCNLSIYDNIINDSQLRIAKIMEKWDKQDIDLSTEFKKKQGEKETSDSGVPLQLQNKEKAILTAKKQLTEFKKESDSEERDRNIKMTENTLAELQSEYEKLQVQNKLIGSPMTKEILTRFDRNFDLKMLRQLMSEVKLAERLKFFCEQLYLPARKDPKLVHHFAKDGTYTYSLCQEFPVTMNAPILASLLSIDYLKSQDKIDIWKQFFSAIPYDLVFSKDNLVKNEEGDWILKSWKNRTDVPFSTFVGELLNEGESIGIPKEFWMNFKQHLAAVYGKQEYFTKLVYNEQERMTVKKAIKPQRLYTQKGVVTTKDAWENMLDLLRNTVSSKKLLDPTKDIMLYEPDWIADIIKNIIVNMKTDSKHTEILTDTFTKILKEYGRSPELIAGIDQLPFTKRVKQLYKNKFLGLFDEKGNLKSIAVNSLVNDYINRYIGLKADEEKTLETPTAVEKAINSVLTKVKTEKGTKGGAFGELKIGQAVNWNELSGVTKPSDLLTKEHITKESLEEYVKKLKKDPPIPMNTLLLDIREDLIEGRLVPGISITTYKVDKDGNKKEYWNEIKGVIEKELKVLAGIEEGKSAFHVKEKKGKKEEGETPADKLTKEETAEPLTDDQKKKELIEFYTKEPTKLKAASVSARAKKLGLTYSPELFKEIKAAVTGEEPEEPEEPQKKGKKSKEKPLGDIAEEVLGENLTDEQLKVKYRLNEEELSQIKKMIALRKQPIRKKVETKAEPTPPLVNELTDLVELYKFSKKKKESEVKLISKLKLQAELNKMTWSDELFDKIKKAAGD